MSGIGGGVLSGIMFIMIMRSELVRVCCCCETSFVLADLVLTGLDELVVAGDSDEEATEDEEDRRDSCERW